jgi:protein ImuA
MLALLAITGLACFCPVFCGSEPVSGTISPTRRDEVARLAALVEDAGLGVRRGPVERFSTGCAALDAALPGGGPVRGTLLEWLGEQFGGGATMLAVAAACEAQRAGGAVVVIDRGDAGGPAFYPPAAAAWGLDLTGVIVVRPTSDADERWALDQALRCEHAAAVLAWPRRLDGRTFRRLQLAAEASGAVGLLVRPAEAQREASWSHVRWVVTPQPTPEGASERWQLAVRLVRVRGGPVVEARRDQSSPRVARPRSAAGRGEPGTPSMLPSRPTTPRADLGVPPPSSSRERAEIVVEIDPVSGAIHEARVGDLAAGLAGAARRPEPA